MLAAFDVLDSFGGRDDAGDVVLKESSAQQPSLMWHTIHTLKTQLSLNISKPLKSGKVTSLQPPIWFISADFRTMQPPFHTHHSSKQKSAKYIKDFNFSQLWTETVLSFWRVRDFRNKSHVKMSWFYSSSGNFGAPDGPLENHSCSQAESKAHNDCSSFGVNKQPVSCAYRGWSLLGLEPFGRKSGWK